MAEDKILPLWKRVAHPIDYFLLVDNIDVIPLRFDFDDLEGINFASLLMANSDAYVDYDGAEGPDDAFDEWLKDLFPDEFKILQAATEDDYPEIDRKHWLNFFDLQFSIAQDMPEDYVILHCVGPHDRGYEGDVMYFLGDRQLYLQLNIPSKYRLSLN